MILKIKNRKLFSGAISLLFLFVLLMPVLSYAVDTSSMNVDESNFISNPNNPDGTFINPTTPDNSFIGGGSVDNVNNINRNYTRALSDNKAQSNINYGLVKCGIANSEGVINNPCDFTDFIRLINDIINWIIGIAGVIFTLMAVYGGFLYMTSGDNPGNKGKAKSILWNTLLGFVIILTAWLIVYTLLNFLVDPSQRGSVFKFIDNGN